MKTGALVLAAVALALLGCREAPKQVVSAGAPEARKPPVIREPVKSQKPTAISTQEAAPVYRVGGDVSRPELLHRAKIDFSRLPGLRMTGTPILEAVISEKGTIESARMLRPTDPRLDSLLIDTVRQWRFRPAMKDGRPVRVYYTVTFNICPQ